MAWTSGTCFALYGHMFAGSEYLAEVQQVHSRTAKITGQLTVDNIDLRKGKIETYLNCESTTKFQMYAKSKISFKSELANNLNISTIHIFPSLRLGP